MGPNLAPDFERIGPESGGYGEKQPFFAGDHHY
jgi:hypothetical protein